MGGEFYQAKSPAPVPEPYMVAYSPEAAKLIGLPETSEAIADLPEYLAGNRLPEGAQPLAMAYSGYQFGSYNSQLGDGRGLLLGEIESPPGENWDLYLKGCGQTRFCRGFDGRATLRSSIREFLASEALAGLGIPTTRALAITGFRELIYRDRPELPAVLSRLARTHIRFGSFEYFHYTNRPDKVQELADHAIQVHFPDWSQDPDRYEKLFEMAVDRTAYMIACWQSVGFAHGVMNTDNFSLLGETFDFGPYGFMDRFNPEYIPNHSDTHGRYAWGRQPEIAHWNLGKLGETLTPLIPTEKLESILETYQARFNRYNRKRMAAKLGLDLLDNSFDELVGQLFKLLFHNRPDYTNFFRNLSGFRLDSRESLQAQFGNNVKELNDWLESYSKLLEREDVDPDEQKVRMNRVNPKFILRNYLADKAIDEALKNSDYSEIESLRLILSNPYEDQQDLFQQRGIDPQLYSSDTPEPHLGKQTSCSA